MKIFIPLIMLAALMVWSCRSTRVSPDLLATAENAGENAAAITEIPAEKEIDYHDASTWILGDFKPDRILYSQHSTWYSDGYNGYAPAQPSLDELKGTDIDGLTITVVMATWCPDSRREVPRFMKIIDLWGFPVKDIRFIGVDMNKVAPLGDYEQLGIARVPTFIFYKNNIEQGRIIEVPVTSLEQDMVNILRR